MRFIGFSLLVIVSSIALFYLHACSDAPSSATEPDPEESTISWVPDVAIDGQAVEYTVSVTNDDGLESVSVSCIMAELVEEFTGIDADTFEQDFEVTYDLGISEAVIEICTITAVSAREHETTREHSITLQPATVTNMPPNINVDVNYDRNWQEDTIEFRVTAQDDFEDLQTIKLDFGDGNINEFNVNTNSIDTVLTHQYMQGGEFSWNALARDTKGLTGQDSGIIDITSLYNINIDTNKITYVGTINGDIVEPDNTARMKLTSRDGSIVKEFEAQNGQITGRIPEGEFEVEYLSDYSKLSRMKVNRDFYPDDWQYLSYMGVDGGAPGEESFVVRGYPSNNPEHAHPSDHNWYFNVTGDINTRAETVKGAIADQGWLGPQRFIPGDELLYMMTHQMNNLGLLNVPRTKDAGGNEIPTFMVYNRGNPAFDCSGWTNPEDPPPETCISMKLVEQGHIHPSELPDGGVNPPGVIPRNPQSTEQKFDSYVALMKQIFNSDIVAGNPYNIEIVKGYSPELTDYMRGWYVPLSSGGVNLISPEDNVFITSHNMGAGTELYNTGIAIGGAFNYTRGSSMFVGTSLRGFKNEATHWFSSREGFPCVYSQRDRTGGDCGVADFPLGFTDLDIIFNKIAASFGPYSQKQKTGFEREMSSNNLANRDGFSITLPRD